MADWSNGPKCQGGVRDYVIQYMSCRLEAHSFDACFTCRYHRPLWLEKSCRIYIYIYTYIHLYSYISVEGPVQEILRRFPSSRSLWQVSVRDLCARSLYKVSVKRPLGKILVRDP